MIAAQYLLFILFIFTVNILNEKYLVILFRLTLFSSVILFINKFDLLSFGMIALTMFLFYDQKQVNLNKIN